MFKYKNLILSLFVSCLLFFTCFFIYEQTDCKNIVLAENNNIIVNNLDSSIAYNYIESPKNLAIVGDDEFYLTNNSGYIYQYKNSQLNLISSNYSTLVSIFYHDEILYILKPGEVIAYNTTTKNFTVLYSDYDKGTNYLSEPINILCNKYGAFIATKTKIVNMQFDQIDSTLSDDVITTTNSYDFNGTPTNFYNIQSVCVTKTNLYALHKTDDNTAFVTKFTIKQSGLEQVYNKQISTSASADCKIFSYLNTDDTQKLIVLYDNKLYPCQDTSEEVNLFSSQSITILEPSSITGYASFTSGKVLSISDFFIYKNYLYVCDGNTKCNSVQRFIIQSNEIAFDTILIASSGSDINRLYNPKALKVIDNNMYILDAGNNRFIIKDMVENSNIEIKDPDISGPVALDVNIDGEIYVVTNQKIKIFEKQKQSIVNLGDYKVCDIQTSFNHTLYMLDKDNKKLLLLNNNQITELLSFNDETTFTESARIKLNASGNKIYLLADNSIYSIDLTKSVLGLDKLFTSENKIIDFVLDYKDNLYCCMLNSTDKYNMCKISSGIVQRSIELPTINNTKYERFFFDLISGMIYNCDSTNHKIETIKITTNLFEVLQDFAIDYSFKDNPQATGANFARITENCNSYQYPFYSKAKIQLNENDKVFVLNEHNDLNNNFAYIMISNKETKNILAYVDCSVLSYDVQEEQLAYNKIKVSYMGNANAYLYYLPTGLEFEDGSPSFRYHRIAKLNEEFNILGLACGFVDGSDMQYYTIKLENDDIVYLKWVYADDASKSKPIATLQANATVEKNTENDKLVIYEYDEMNNIYKKTDIELQNKQAVQVMSSFDSNQKYVLIKYEDSKGNLSLGYIETKYIVYSDITWLQIVGIILGFIAIILIIVAITIIIKNVKRRQLSQIEEQE